MTSKAIVVLRFLALIKYFLNVFYTKSTMLETSIGTHYKNKVHVKHCIVHQGAEKLYPSSYAGRIILTGRKPGQLKFRLSRGWELFKAGGCKMIAFSGALIPCVTGGLSAPGLLWLSV
jgi:hypothetical protein